MRQPDSTRALRQRRAGALRSVLGLLLVSLVAPALAEESTSAPPEAEADSATPVPSAEGEPPEPPPDAPEPWAPPQPDAKEFDWIRFKSGEWLKGRIRRLRIEEKLEFESDQLDDLDIDWDDVAEFRSPHVYTYAFTDRRVARGSASMREGRIRVATSEGVREFERAELLSIVPAGTRELDRWDGKLSIGVDVRSGNTNQAEFNSFGYLRRSSELTRLRVDYNGAISEVEEVQTVNNHTATAKLDLFVSKRLYVTPAAINAFKDVFQNIRIRLTPYAGVGYHIVDRRKFKWDVELAAGAQFTRFESVEAGSDTQSVTGALIPGTRLEWDITKRLELDASYRLQIGVPSVEDSFQHFFSVLSFEITNILDLDVSFTWDYVANPEPNADGSVPLSNDFRLSIGLGIEF